MTCVIGFKMTTCSTKAPLNNLNYTYEDIVKTLKFIDVNHVRKIKFVQFQDIIDEYDNEPKICNRFANLKKYEYREYLSWKPLTAVDFDNCVDHLVTHGRLENFNFRLKEQTK